VYGTITSQENQWVCNDVPMFLGFPLDCVHIGLDVRSEFSPPVETCYPSAETTPSRLLEGAHTNPLSAVGVMFSLIWPT
jgi:hypothetical protein